MATRKTKKGFNGQKALNVLLSMGAAIATDMAITKVNEGEKMQPEAGKKPVKKMAVAAVAALGAGAGATMLDNDLASAVLTNVASACAVHAAKLVKDFQVQDTPAVAGTRFFNLNANEISNTQTQIS